ncbi:MAG: response regulator [Desulfobacteraceae bacterium]|nr:MAG: response regulator [Desulfobacteraceae bacterium]
MVLLALEELLKPEGYQIGTATRGAEALVKMEQQVFDLVLIDVIMPEMDGYELCRRIRLRPEYAETPVIFLTAKSREEDRAQGLEAGGNLYLSKPISPDKLLKIIADAAGRRGDDSGVKVS